MESLENPDPFVVYQAAEKLKGYIDLERPNFIVDILHRNKTRIHATTNNSILELLHILLKHTRKQMKNGSNIDPNNIRSLFKLFAVNNKQSADHFSDVACPSPYHLVVVIDLFKLMQLAQEDRSIPPHYREIYQTQPLSATDIEKIRKCLESNNIIAVRKSLELLWRNVNVTDDASTIELTLSVSMSYLFSAFNTSNDIIVRLLQIDTEFFYSPLAPHIAIDCESLKRAIKACLASYISAARIVRSGAYCPSNFYHAIENTSSQVHEIIKGYCRHHGKPALVDLFMNICGKEDNDMIAIQHNLLQLAVMTSNLVQDQKHIDMAALKLVDPHESKDGIKHAELFVHILFRMGLDHTTLLDMLISADTQFLKFFLQFLRYVEENTQDFKIACARAAADLLHNEDDGDDQSEEWPEVDLQMLDIVSEILDALNIDLQMPEFPYNPKILMNRIQNVIDKLSTDV
ncbi:hypothetical protein BGW37DRAFT_467935 [Umbelopsis sp. PMI_123]|nr:hypothetical protein BGW37DRAFT_467935 [Umbelopsis sp. PMI_123]